MTKSMTAFSRSDQNVKVSGDQVNIVWEMRSVNHRYLDISLSLPESLNAFENKLKEQIRNKLGRGKVDAKLLIEAENNQADEEIVINQSKVKALLSARHMLESISKKPVMLSGMDILSWPGVLEDRQEDGEAHLTDATAVLDAALDLLIEARAVEGERLKALILSRCELIVELVKSVKARRVEVVAALREKVLKKLAELDVTADPNRLEQEMVFQTQRLDVDEELDRLDSHIDEVKDVLERDEPVGRRLDFLMQELHREANTLASKSNDAETTKSAVELKVLIEQMREQCLNIE